MKSQKKVYTYKTVKCVRLKPEQISNMTCIMLIGETGTGKSTLLETLINIYYGVKLNDNYRFQIDRQTVTSLSQTSSQTADVFQYIVFNTNRKELQQLAFIDTPGLGDTNGIINDYENYKKISNYLKSLNSLSCIGFVIKQNQNRFTSYQKYIAELFLELFGDDISKCFAVFCTHAEKQQKNPQAVNLTKTANIPSQNIFQFDNSGVMPYAGGEDDDNDEFSQYADIFIEGKWKLCQQEAERFFDDISTQKNLKKLCLSKTKDLLDYKEILEIRLQVLMVETNQVYCQVKILQSYLETNAELKKRIPGLDQLFSKQYAIENSENQQQYNSINCTSCQQTCHENCKEVNNQLNTYKCSIFQKENCTKCTDKCHYTAHKIEEFTYKKDQIEKRVLDVDQLLNFLIYSSKVDQIQEITDSHINVLMEKKICAYLINEIQKISYKKSNIGYIEYLKQLLSSEQLQKNDGWEKKCEFIENKIAILQIKEQLIYNKNELEIFNRDTNLAHSEFDQQLYEQFLKEEKATLNLPQYKKPDGLFCPRLHLLNKRIVQKTTYVCDQCNEYMDPQNFCYDCQICDFQLCINCIKNYNMNSVFNPTRYCPKQHFLEHIFAGPLTKNIQCDECDNNLDAQIGTFRCHICDFDRCDTCLFNN